MLYVDNTERKIELIRYLFLYYKNEILNHIEDETEFLSLGSIDGITFWDRESGVVKTKFGSTSVENISSGFKTILLANYFGKTHNNYILSLYECGPNALKVIFELSKKYDIYVNLPGYNIPYYECPIQIVGGKIVNNTKELREELF